MGVSGSMQWTDRPTVAGEEEKTWTDEEEKIVRNKLDWRLVPLLTALYLVCFLDRANIGNARIQGMAKDLNLVGFQFNWALTVFYVPYLLVEVPSNVLLRKVGPRVYIPFLVFVFGFMSLLTAFVKSFTHLCVARAFLGLFEGGSMPGIAFFLSCFYRRHELYFRIGIFISSSSLSGAFGGLLAAALAKIPMWGVASTMIHTWRNIFFFEGIMTMLVAIIGWTYLPSSPSSCFFLTERERFIAVERIRREHNERASDDSGIVRLQDVKRGILNWNNVFCALGFFMVNVTVQSFSLFLPTILNDLGWTATKAQLYTVPPYAIAACLAIAVAYISDKTRRRGIYLFFGALIVIIGYAILRTVSGANVKYMAVFFCAAGAFPGGPGFLSWGVNNAAPSGVRAVASGFIVSVGTIGAIVATWTYIPSDGPRYVTGHTINLGAQAVAALLALSAILYIKWENR